MAYFRWLAETAGGAPDWCVLVPPVLLLVLFVPLAILRRRRTYLLCALLLTGAGCLMLATDAGVCLFYAICLFLLSAALYPVFCLPKKKRQTREERLFERFGEGIPPAPGDPREEKPLPKVCCYEDPPPVPAAESRVSLGHVERLIEKLRREKLSPADRLEVDAIARSLEGGESPSRSALINDSLASVLRLTAKYKL